MRAHAPNPSTKSRRGLSAFELRRTKSNHTLFWLSRSHSTFSLSQTKSALSRLGALVWTQPLFYDVLLVWTDLKQNRRGRRRQRRQNNKTKSAREYVK